MLTALLIALLAAPAHAQERSPREVELRPADGPYGLGLGVVIGDPTGLSVLVRADDRHAIQGGVGWSVFRDSLTVTLDYLLTLAIIRFPEEPDLKMLFYVGGGGALRVSDDPTLGVRVPVGLAVLPTAFPVDFFVQVSPGLRLLPDPAFDVDAGIGARVFF